jgi:hypothetical protein
MDVLIDLLTRNREGNMARILVLILVTLSVAACGNPAASTPVVVATQVAEPLAAVGPQTVLAPAGTAMLLPTSTLAAAPAPTPTSAATPTHTSAPTSAPTSAR